MGDTQPKRILRLLMMLSGVKRYSMEELRERLNMSDRNIRRDLNLIDTSGFLLDRKKGYRLEPDNPTNRRLKNLLHFSEEEVTILYETLSLIEGDSPVKERLVRKLNTFYDLKALEQLKQKDDLTKVHTIRESMKQKKQVMLKAYRSSNSGSIEDRRVEVFDFLADYRGVWCYDLNSHTCKQFKIARMQSVELLPSQWRYEREHHKPFTDIFRVSASKPFATVELRLSLKAYNLLIEEYPLAVAHIKEKDKSYHLKTPVANYNGVGRFVLGLIGDIEISKPAGFKKCLKAQIENFLK